MSKQGSAEIFNVYQTWIASGQCPKAFLMPGTKVMDKRYEQVLDRFVEEKCGGVYNPTNLGLAAIFVLLDNEWKAKFAQAEYQWKTQLAEAAWNRIGKEVDKWVSENPNFRADDTSFAIIRDFFEKNPNASVSDWSDFCEANPHDERLWKQPRPLDLVALARGLKASNRLEYDAKIAKLKNTYGPERVDAAFAEIQEAFSKRQNLETWRETPQETAERHKQEAADAKVREAEKQKKLEASAQVEAESIVSGFRGQTHAESFRVREQLQNILVYKADGSANVDWQATAEARRATAASYQGKNPGVVNPLAV